MQCLAPSAHRRMVWRREIKTKQSKNGCDQPFGLAQRQAENRPQRQRRRDSQGRVARLAAARGAGLSLPRRNRCFREPDSQASALAQGDVIGGPIRHPVPLLRDVMAAILVRFEWHGDGPGLGTGSPSYTLHPSPPNDRSVQQGLAGQEVMQRQDRRLSGWWSFGLGTGCMMTSSVLVTAFALLTAIRPSPWYDPRYAIPLLGMILGNCMTGIALGLNTLTTSLMLRRASVEAELMLGATRWNAAAPVT